MINRNYVFGVFLSRVRTALRIVGTLVFAFALLGAASIVRADTVFTATLNGSQAVPATGSNASGVGSAILNESENEVTVTINLTGFQNTPFTVQIHSPANRGANADTIFSLPTGVSTRKLSVNALQAADLKAGLWYFNVVTGDFPGGVIRGQIEPLCAPPPENIAALYRAENNAEDSFNNNGGTTPSGIGYTNGKIGQAFSFNGANQFADLGNFFDFKIFTVSMWVKPGTEQLAFANMVDNNRSATANWAIEQNNAATNQYNYIDNGGSVTFDLNPNVWQHLTVVRSENAIRIYRNGVAMSSIIANPLNYDGAQTLLLARYFNRINQGSNRNWSGQIDEFAVFTRTLSETEIRSLYLSGSSGVCNDSAIMTAQNGKVVFSRQLPTNNSNIFSINSDGSNLTNLSNSNRNDRYASFSPDGTKIVFERTGSLFTMNADGSNQQLVPRVPNLLQGFPNWSPDGNRIVYTHGINETSEIYTVNSNGTNQRRLTNNTHPDTNAEFSPDSSKIVFQSTRSPNNSAGIYLMNSDGSNAKLLPSGWGGENAASWSPDGSKIVHNRSSEIFVMNADGTGGVNITKTPNISEYSADWSPDGTKIVFTRQTSTAQQLWIMNPDGSGQTCLVCEGINTNANWQPTLNNQNVAVFPVNNIKLLFSFVETRGRVAATQLPSEQLPPLPSEFLPASLLYDIRTSAVYQNPVTVSFVVKPSNASECEQFRLLHFTDGAWNDSGNDTPVFNGSGCTVSKTVSKLAPFIVGRRNISSTTSLSGAILYGTTPVNSPAKFVSSVLLTATGSTHYSLASNPSGVYTFEKMILGGAYNVEVLKTGNVNGISAFDATLVLRHVAAGGNGALTPNQLLAADTDGDRAVSAFDATQILRFVAAGGQTNGTGIIGNWKFIPSTRNYSSLPSSLSDQNYEAILLGEVSGDWEPRQTNSPVGSDMETVSAISAKDSFFAEMKDVADIGVQKEDGNSGITLPDKTSASGGAQVSLQIKAARMENEILVIPVLLTNNRQSISGYTFDVSFDPETLELDTAYPIETTDTLTANNFSVVSDTATPGRAGVAAASGANSITTSGTLLKLRFKVIDRERFASGKSTLILSRNLIEKN